MVLLVPPVQPVIPPTEQGIPASVPALNWSHFKPEFAGKPDDNSEVHLLRKKYWMETHTFPEGVKVQKFCLTIAGEARLWYELLRPIAVHWNGVQPQFRKQYSGKGNTRELFHAWRFHFDQNSETTDSYVTIIRQVTVLLGYSENQVLDVFSNTLLSRLYWFHFPMGNLRQASLQVSQPLFHSWILKTVLGVIIRLCHLTIIMFWQLKLILTAMMTKETTQNNNQAEPFKPKLHPGKMRVQGRNNYYESGRQQTEIGHISHTF